jgi:mannose-6-phosphate isomerase-like protein (cupin superfamily)
VSRTLKLTPTESVTIRESTPDLLEVEATYGPVSREPPKHLHPSQDEHFEVLAGTIRTRIDGEERDLGASETIDIPRRTVHTDPPPEPIGGGAWGPCQGELRVIPNRRPAVVASS